MRKFLSPVEVQHLVDLASGAKGDVVIDAQGGSEDGSKEFQGTNAAEDAARPSAGGWIHREQDMIVDTIFCCLSDLLNIDKRLMMNQVVEDYVSPTHERIVEAMQLLRYGPGEEYPARHDFTYPSIENRYQPKRYATIIMYLTGEGDVVENGVVRRSSRSSGKHANNNVIAEDGLRGGETTFPRAITTDFHHGVKVEPQSGKAILFYNFLPDGNADDLSQHSGGMVEKGVKYVSNVWVWDPIVN